MLIDPRLKELGEAKYLQYKQWFEQRLEDAIQAAERSKIEQIDHPSNSKIQIF